MSVKRCMREVDSPEFAEWMAYSMIEPFGPDREDERAGMIAALIANVNRDPKLRPEPYDVDDFFPSWDAAMAKAREATEGPPPDKLKSKLAAWAAAMANNKTLNKSELKPKG